MNRPRVLVRGIWGLILCLGMAACSAGTVTPASNGPHIAATDKPDYRCSEGCNQPVWVNTIPEDAGGKHYFVGFSGYHESEQAAREEALRNARKDYAQYTGVEVSSLDEVVRASFGLSSAVIDATVSGRSHDEQKTDASVSRFKGQKYHMVRYVVSRYGKPAGSAIQYYVLADVPVDEIERVKEWQKEKKAIAGAVKAEQQGRFQQSLQRFEQSLAAGEAMNAFGHWRSAAELASGNADSATLKAALLRWGQAITLDVGRFGTLCVVASSKGCVLPVWAHAQEKPLAQLPLLLRNAQGVVVARAMTASDGRGEFLVPAELKGTLRVELDAESGYPPVATQVNLMSADDFGEHLRAAVMSLFSGPKAKPLPVSSLTLGPVTYQRGPAAGEFALAIKGELRQALTGISGLKVRDPQPRTVAVISEAVTRGIAVSGKKNISLGDSSIQAAIDGADAALDIDYLLQGNNVVLALSLVRAYNDDVLRTAQITIPANALPAGITPRPGVADHSPAIATGAVRLDIASHLGAGQVYREGETIRYFLSSDRDCQLLLIYQDAGGQLLQIFPNIHSRDSRMRRGSFVEFPGESDPFEFTVAPPYGTERVYAFASSRPFPTLPGEDAGGLRLLSGSLDSLQKTLRNFARTSGGDYGEAVAVVVTAPKD